MNVDGVISNLMQGVSQQNPDKRVPGQCTTQINAVNDVVDGWKRRPPTEFIANLFTSPVECRWHFYDNGTEQFIVCVFSSGSIKVFDTTGAEQEVSSAGDAIDYLKFSTPEQLQLVTVGDYTMVSNSSIVVRTSSVYFEDTLPICTLQLSGVNYNIVLTVTVNGLQVATYTAPGSSSQLPTIEFIMQNI